MTLKEKKELKICESRKKLSLISDKDSNTCNTVKYTYTYILIFQLIQDEVEVSNILQRAIQALAERPVLFRYTLDEYATARRSTTVRGFIDALTRGSRDQGQPRPIELHSHDPLRYVGDMAAWLHQCAATEVNFDSFNFVH